MDAPLTYLEIFKIPMAVPIALREKHMNIPMYPRIFTGENMRDITARDKVASRSCFIIFIYFESYLLFLSIIYLLEYTAYFRYERNTLVLIGNFIC